MFSKACEYGIKSVLFIATHSKQGEKVGIKQIAESSGTPEAFTGKILQQLGKAGIISSTKGRGGGFFLSDKQLRSKTLSDLVLAIDGDALFRGCGLGLEECNAKKPCPLHHQFVEIRKKLNLMLKNTTIELLSDELIKGLTFLKR